MKTIYRFIASVTILTMFLLTVACGPTANQVKPVQTVTVGKTFQTQTTPLPSIPQYRCGAWSSNNAPNPASTITILAKLTQNVMGVAGAAARATVHFQEGDMTIDQQPKSDQGGLVSFILPLQQRQPVGVPATVSVSFTIGGTAVQCSSAFFTPQ